MLSLSANAMCLVACVAAGLSAVVAAWGVFLARGSTAVPAGIWAVAACLALAVETGAGATGGLAGAAAAVARLAVVALSLCPTMSLLGAKRPQHGVWQLIVATLAVVLVMPGVSALLMRPGSMPDVYLLERCFMPLLVVVGWMNFVGTGRATAATSIAAAQLILMRGFLPGVATDAAMPVRAEGNALDAAAAVLLCVGTVLTAIGTLASRTDRPRPASVIRHPVASAIDPPFLALRETLGAAWTLRIAERFDAVADTRGWPCRLRFGGLETGGDPADTFWHRDAMRAFRALARRFVTDAWLARHGWPFPDARSPDARVGSGD